MNAKAIVTLVVSAMVLVCVAVPVIADNSSIPTSQDNEGINRYYRIYSGESFEIEKLEIGFAVDGVSQGSILSLFSSTLSITWASSQNTFYVNDWKNEAHFVMQAGDTLSVDNFRVTGTGSLASLDATLNKRECVYTAPQGETGEYAIFNGAFYANDDSIIWLAHNNTPALLAKGTIASGFDTLLSMNYLESGFSDVVVTDIGVTNAEVEDSPKTYNVSGGTYTYSGSAATPLVIAPVEYYVLGDGGTTGALIGVIPILLVIGLLMSAVYVMRRD